MTRISRPIVVSLFLIASAPAYAQETPAEWAAKLGNGNYAEREKAARALEQLGKPALQALLKVMTTSDLETKRRAIIVMERIEDRLMQDELAAATPVHLRFQDISVDDALHEIERQIGLGSIGHLSDGNALAASLLTPYGLHLGILCHLSAGHRRITKIDTKKLPYWQAWRQFCVAADLTESDYTRSAAKLKKLRAEEVQELMATLTRLELDVRPRVVAPRIEFMIAPQTAKYSVDDSRSVRVRVKWHSLDEKAAQAVFAVEVRAEPRLEVVSVPLTEITKVVDDQGRTKVVQPVRSFPEAASGPDAQFLAAYAGEIQYGGLLQLKSIAWPEPIRSLKELHGRIRMDVSVRPRMIEFPNVIKSAGQEVRGFQGITLKVLEAEMTDEGNLHLRLHLDNIESLTPQTQEQKIVRVRPGVLAERGVMDVAIERLAMIDALGRRCMLVKSRYEQAAQGKGYLAELSFAVPGNQSDQLMLVMTKAARTVSLDMPFHVRDLAWTQK